MGWVASISTTRQVYLSQCGIAADQTYRRYSLTGPPSSRISTPTSAFIVGRR